jgi:nucleoside-diphosphate-sugar epimerase
VYFDKNMYGLRLMRNFGSQRFLITGASGQIGSELIPYMSQRYGIDSVVASDLTRRQLKFDADYEFVSLDVCVIST